MRPKTLEPPAGQLVAIERRRGRSWYRLRAEDGESWVVDREAMLTLAFVPEDPGKLPVPLTAGQRQLLEEAERATARRRVLTLLAHRARSRRELERLVGLWPFRRESVADALSWAAQLGYVDDRELAEQIIALSRHHPVGRAGLIERLEQRGIDPDVARQAVQDEMPPEAEREQASRLLRKRLGALQSLPEPEKARRLWTLLLRRGFEAEVARAALAEVLGPQGVRSIEEVS